MPNIRAVIAFAALLAVLPGLGGCSLPGAAAADPPEIVTDPPETDAPIETDPPDGTDAPTETEPPDGTDAPIETEPPRDPAPPAETVFPSGREAEERARALLSGMTEEEKLYQLFVVYPEAVTGTAGTTTAATEANTLPALKARPVGGLVYAEANLQSAEQASAMIAGQQAFTAIPLLTCVDEEGGRVTRIRRITGSLSAMYTYREDGPDTAYGNAVTIAGNMKTLGLNTDLAPVADVWSNPANSVIGDRAYSGDYASAATLVAAAVEGFRSENLICTLKHFPGHGDTAEDSHTSSAVVRKTLDELREQEFLPFKAGIEAGADMVMIGHLTLTEVDPDTPATFSRTIVTDLLRGELGFDGVIITDAMTMAAATNHTTGGEACIEALAAGCDILLGAAATPDGLDKCVQAIRDELDKPGGRLGWDDIDGSVARILTMKIEHGLI